jgi:hypothetical protein
MSGRRGGLGAEEDKRIGIDRPDCNACAVLALRAIGAVGGRAEGDSRVVNERNGGAQIQRPPGSRPPDVT